MLQKSSKNKFNSHVIEMHHHVIWPKAWNITNRNNVPHCEIDILFQYILNNDFEKAIQLMNFTISSTDWSYSQSRDMQKENCTLFEVSILCPFSPQLVTGQKWLFVWIWHPLNFHVKNNKFTPPLFLMAPFLSQSREKHA